MFSITLVRSQAEVEYARQQKEKAKSGGFFSFLRGKKSESEEAGTCVCYCSEVPVRSRQSRPVTPSHARSRFINECNL